MEALRLHTPAGSPCPSSLSSAPAKCQGAPSDCGNRESSAFVSRPRAILRLGRRCRGFGAAPPISGGQGGRRQGDNRYQFGDGFHRGSAGVGRLIGGGGLPMSKSISASALL